MNRIWGLLFLAVPILSVGLFVVAPGMGWWWPEPISTYGGEIDYFFWLITAITTVAFIVTECLLALFVFKYTAARPGPANPIAHNTTVEVVWTLSPALILLWLGLYQLDIWKRIKVPSHFPDVPVLAEVTARQFEWRFRYPGPDGKFRTPDDIQVLNDLHFPLGEPIRIRLYSQDVLHSFFLPNLRIKQDAVPGMEIPVWFEATKDAMKGERRGNACTVYDLVCAELCGWGHYKMRGQITIHDTRAGFEAWLETARLAQEASQEVAR